MKYDRLLIISQKGQQKMKQIEFQQVKFPKPQQNVSSSLHIPQPPKPKPTAQSQMIRIIIALLIAIFIYNSSQQTTINYNEIIKNQKMFLVKNIRGVIPTLSGNLYNLQEVWKVAHFENYKQNDSEIFNNFTLTFNSTSLVVENKYCNTKLVYDWKNYSYNIDFELLSETTLPMAMIVPKNNKEANGSVKNGSNSRILQEITEQISPNNPQTGELAAQQTQFQSQQQQQISSSQNLQSVSKQDPSSPQTSQGKIDLSKEQQKCTKNINYFKEVILFTSVWTISGQNLYLLMENAKLDEDFYMILRPVE